jgi:MoCo/4Fe-4S cofactor protein with predicted Tat translocation signal
MSRLKVLSEPAAAAAAAGEERRVPEDRPRLDLEAVREKLAAARGPETWRSLEELAVTPELEELLHREFPRQASQWAGGDVSRRRFLQVMSASLALGGLTACTTQPKEAIVPYVDQPEGLVPGEPWYFATTHTLNGYGRGVLVESHTGRPTKVEGNPQHPASAGATDVFAQASVLDLYDPDRAQVVKRLGRVSQWSRLEVEMARAMEAQGALGGAGLRLLTGAVSSPTLRAQIEAVLAAHPRARWHVWEPAAAHNARLGTRRALGEGREAVYDLTQAEAVLALDSDFLTVGPGAVAYARQFTARRRAWKGAEAMAVEAGAGGRRPDSVTGEAGREMLRLYAVESSPTSTGTLADHRMALPPSEVVAFARALAAELGVGGGDGGGHRFSKPAAAKWVREVARDLRSRGGAALVVPGDYAPAELHELAVRINRALGAVGRTVRYERPVVAGPDDQAASLAELVADLDAGEVDVLVVLGGNPVYTAPADLDFTAALEKARLRVYHGLHEDETAAWCQWLVPAAHYLESWGDAVAWDGTASLVQPLIEPLYPAAKSEVEMVAALAGRGGVAGYDLVREHWQGAGALGGDFETGWRRALHDGVLPAPPAAPPAAEPAAPPAGEEALPGPTLGTAATVAAVEAEEQRREVTGGETAVLEVNLRPDPTVWDGRYANNAWLQELPKPVTKLTWDNALQIGPATAQRLGLQSSDLVELAWRGRTLQVPVWVVPAQADRSATLHLGYGRRRAGRVGNDTGFDASALRTSDALWTLPAVEVRRLPGRYPLACTQDHHSMEGRHLVRSGTVETFEHHPEFAKEMVHTPEISMYPPYVYDGYAWGMAVDLNACTGCNACVVACQSENNIPVVGKEQVLNAREMHWLRIDRYYEGSLDDPKLHTQPVMCQHCELAPCEVVCPVAATVHSDEGTNDMIYNRCVGTRYCSNNCPYKVRRFNFLQWVDRDTEVLKAVRNPDVTVRSRGVMEKCTYCIQRVNAARIEAKRERGRVEDGAILTACQQACPSDAIVFGDVNDEGSRVSRWKAQPLDYGLLEDLNTRPRTSYLAKLTNPNPELES